MGTATADSVQGVQRAPQAELKTQNRGLPPVQTMACPTEDSGTLTLAGERVQLQK